MSGDLPKDHTVRIYDIDAGGWTHAAVALIDNTGKEIGYFSLYPDKPKEPEEFEDSKEALMAESKKIDNEMSSIQSSRHIFGELFSMIRDKGTFKDDHAEHEVRATKSVSIPVSKQEFDAMLAKAKALQAGVAGGTVHYSVSSLLGLHCGAFVREVLQAGLKDRPYAEHLFAMAPAQKIVSLPSTQFWKYEKFQSGHHDELAKFTPSLASPLSLGTGTAAFAIVARNVAKTGLPVGVKAAATAVACVAGWGLGHFWERPRPSSGSSPTRV